MSDENPYVLPNVDESQWFTGSHLGTQTQSANWQIVNVTTPANYFMVLRRQVRIATAPTATTLSATPLTVIICCR